MQAQKYQNKAYWHQNTVYIVKIMACQHFRIQAIQRHFSTSENLTYVEAGYGQGVGHTVAGFIDQIWY